MVDETDPVKAARRACATFSSMVSRPSEKVEWTWVSERKSGG